MNPRTPDLGALDPEARNCPLARPLRSPPGGYAAAQ